jgi:hypothetical protein
MDSAPRIKPPYVLARCCSPTPRDPITGYHSHEKAIKVHRADCANLLKAEPSRLVMLRWPDITQDDDPRPGVDIETLSETDFNILDHHRRFGVDYSLKVAQILQLAPQIVFDSHQKLRAMKLLVRVEPTMIQYRKGIVDNRWVKHRNHTYYQLTEKGRLYLAHRP